MTSAPRTATPRASLDPAAVADAAAAVREANLAFARRYPGERDEPQPVHTLIEGAQHFSADVAARRGQAALAALAAHAPDAYSLGSALGIAAHPALDDVSARVREKLAREPVEDYRIDFEDGYGVRPDAEEDARAAAVGAEVARGLRDGTLPPSLGVRVKPLTEELRARSVRTLDLLTTAIVDGGGPPPRWLVTFPKITVAEQLAYGCAVLGALERSSGIADGTLRCEIQVEVPQAIIDSGGRSLLPRLIDAAGGRLVSVDFGTYDYTAGCGITAAFQQLRHPACDFAKHVIQLSFAGTGVWIADGSTSVLPIPLYEAGPDAPLSALELEENYESVRAGWRRHFDDVRHSLAGGYYQGWDLHPAQLVSRYAAVSSFFLEGVEAAGARLRHYLANAERATALGNVLDEPATGQGLLGFFLRAIQSGAVRESEAAALTGLTPAELRNRSFVSIMRARSQARAQARTAGGSGATDAPT